MRTANFVHAVSGWLLLLALAAAPWGLGSLWPGAIDFILAILLLAVGAWVAGLILGRRRPATCGLTWIGLALLLQGWAMTLHPVAHYDVGLRRFIGSGAAGGLAGTLDSFSSFLTMRSVTVLFLAFHVALDHLHNARFRGRFLWTLAGNGAAVAVLGFLQRAGLTTFLLGYMNPLEGQAFGPFNYHGNAGAFLLFCLPAAGVLAAVALARGKTVQGIAAAILAAAVLGGLCICTSRAAAVLGILEAGGLGVAFWRIFSPAFAGAAAARTRGRWGWGVAVAVMLAAGLAIVCMPAKWRLLAMQVTGENGRFIVWRMGAGMARDAGFFGTGPGTFGVLLPLTPHFDPELYRQAIVTFPVPGQQVSMWVHAHNDLLQAFIEWGWIGGMLWAIVAAAVIFRGVKAAQRIGGRSATERAESVAVLVALLAVMAQSLVDFPFQVLALQLPAVLCAACLFSAAAGRKNGGRSAGNLTAERVDAAARIRSGGGVAGEKVYSPVVRRRHRSADNAPAQGAAAERPWRNTGR